MSSPSVSVASLGDLRYQNQGNARLLELVPGTRARILDVGCGAGDNARMLSERGHSVTGVTLSQAEAAAARAYCESVRVGDVETMALDDVAAFDVLLMSHVLEHLVNPTLALTRLARYVRPGGLLLGAVPNMANWRVRWRVLRGDWTRDETGAFDRTHLHFWSVETAGRMLEETPFALTRVIGADASVPLRPVRRVSAAAAARLDDLAGRVSSNLFASQVLVVGERRPLS